MERDSEASGGPLKKRLVGQLARRGTIACYTTIPCYFGFDSPARVCFLSVPSAAGLTFLLGLCLLGLCLPELCLQRLCECAGSVKLKAALKSSLYRTPFIAEVRVRGCMAGHEFRKRGIRPRGTSNARTFQVEQQMVAGCYSADCLVGFGRMEQHRAPGIRFGCPQHSRT